MALSFPYSQRSFMDNGEESQEEAYDPMCNFKVFADPIHNLMSMHEPVVKARWAYQVASCLLHLQCYDTRPCDNGRMHIV